MRTNDLRKIILASGSAQRRKLMDGLGLAYDVFTASIDEKLIRDTDLTVRAEKIARAKAEKVAAEHDGIVIAGDTFCGVDGNALEKPATIEEAAHMLRLQSGRSFDVYTGFCYIDRARDIDFSTTVTLTITMRKLEEGEIAYVVHALPVTTWSGAFAPQDPYCATMIARVDGSLTGFQGIPMEHLVPLLIKSGVNVWNTK